ncbi:MAG: imidazole glycerol phosphate synthase subunit HisH [Pelagibacterales bacterium]|nr:imidazole glycerol phosphate synthase subunit HisH [Pelagibacterales bacterium]PPR16655.1 MAG: Imidazole glycerol phosphate synthase subunit HisH 1 [Alphaproteobacteria bacterium MarineAlpha9_Bin3]|tara:strand:- start:13533 stop:14174 length:642 start_codon:yes stop_codon:yes gene_type:complete
MYVGIIDYGSGNIRSVLKSFEKAASLVSTEIQIKIIKNADELKKIEKIVLPGVGAFADCMEGLKSRVNLIEMLNKKVIEEKKPFLGICVGMQLLANSSSEYGHTKGLSWLDGEVENIKIINEDIKIPHMGWNSIIFDKDDPLLINIKKGEDFYFVHSYQFNVKENNFVLAKTNYGADITAIVLKNNILGTQFHPEKSQRAGIQFIKNFLEWKP